MISRAKRRAKRCIKSNCTPSREVIVASHPLGSASLVAENPATRGGESTSSFRDAFHSAAFFTSPIQAFLMPRIPVPSTLFFDETVTQGSAFEKGVHRRWLAIVSLINWSKGRRKRKDFRTFSFSFEVTEIGILIFTCWSFGRIILYFGRIVPFSNIRTFQNSLVVILITILYRFN